MFSNRNTLLWGREHRELGVVPDSIATHVCIEVINKYSYNHFWYI